MAKRDKPWVIRTYAGHSSATASNELYRRNLAKGQTGLSVAFDLPTQTGYDPDAVLARGEVGKVGVPIAHVGDLRALFEGIPLAEMNTSMTINATAMWLLALYQVVAEELRVPARALAAPDDGHDRVHRQPRAEVEPDQHLQLPPAGGRGDPRPGDRLRPEHRHRRAGRRP
jgi:methylmalonyl-CoA mutase cobalamin-binding domain/chain